MSFVAPTEVQDETFVYTVNKRRRNQMELQYVSLNANGALAYMEKLYLTLK